MSLIGFCVLTVLSAALALAIIVAGGAGALASQQVADQPQKNPSITPDEALAPNSKAHDTFHGMITDSQLRRTPS
jgi:hypothetical protein